MQLSVLHKVHQTARFELEDRYKHKKNNSTKRTDQKKRKDERNIKTRPRNKNKQILKLANSNTLIKIQKTPKSLAPTRKIHEK